MLLGCIADDYTGASDLANALTKSGMRTVQLIGLPDKEFSLENVDAIVVALKSRSVPAEDAVNLSLDSLRWLQEAGAVQILFKYCSTFDSTSEGNIGPVAEALLKKLETKTTIVCPAFPENKRTVYQGHLFVGDKLLNESGMENHPLNPMRDANLVRVLQQQTSLKVELIGLAIVNRGEESIREALAEIASKGESLVIIDAVTNEHLKKIAAACADEVLITGGSGIALGLSENFRSKGVLKVTKPFTQEITSRAVVLSGSCSKATLNQVEYYRAINPSYSLEIARLLDETDQELLVSEVTDWVLDHSENQAPLVFSSAVSESVFALQEKFGREKVSLAIESFFGQLAFELGQRGVRRFIIAGGETSGAVLDKLGVKALHIGREIDPGVPAMFSMTEPSIGFVLKSGNFGSADFFSKAQKFI